MRPRTCSLDGSPTLQPTPQQGYTAADYAEHVRTEHSTFRWLLEPMLTAAGFEVAEVSYERRLYAAYTCIKAR